jgi:transmembrane sensor
MHNKPPRPLTPDPSGDPINWETLARYLAGESSGAESERISQWLAEHKTDAALLEALDKAMAGLALRDAVDVDVDRALSRVAERRDSASADRVAPIRRTSSDLHYSRRTPLPWRAVTLLATAAAIIVAARLVLQRNGGEQSSGSRPGTGRTFATTVGKRDSLRLPDGGRVILGPASRLVVGAEYGRQRREVELHGEAYFDVVHDTTRPFVVRAGGVDVRDVGTRFAVRADSGTRVRVVVTAGSVMLRAETAPDSVAMLRAGDVAVVQPGGGIATQRGLPTAQYLAWMRDSLVLRDASLAEVSDELRRWYGVVLRVEDSTLATRHLTMTFAGDPLDRVLRVIGLGLGADLERRGDTIVVRPSTRSTRTQ